MKKWNASSTICSFRGQRTLLLVPTGRDEETGNVQYLDLSYIYPYDSLLRPARTVMNQLVAGGKYER